MANPKLILIETLCTHYKIEVSFIDSLSELGLIELYTVEEIQYLPEEKLSLLEKMIRIHQDLQINPEGIDVIFRLLDKVETLNKELQEARRKLKELGVKEDESF
ncbi:chaperone modulator CbpM [Algoriphagus aestuariicola]|jgi:hypothetical protein|uniref:Chaperone modulator CbpM n=1 Tax=Algoriphagus aestuariicola TaxID=1852016 RepID=A0ABS3BVG1_9BACT|nr:chaperone modulator CbpM [Algoriphagus aestuariicola]MBN7803262.1 chaperone modulator CbpM [Algoriphagus aestuariicola]